MFSVKPIKYYVLFGILLICLLILSFYFNFSEENIGYHIFSFEFINNFEFIIIDRSPLYVIFLSGINSVFEYPTNLKIEFVLVRIIFVISFFILFKKFYNEYFLLLIIFIWLPFFNVITPQVQLFSISLFFLAVYIRFSNNEYRISFFYCILILAFLSRSIFLPIIIIYLIYDFYIFFSKKLYAKKDINNIKFYTINIIPVLISLTLLLIIITNQSSLTINNFNFDENIFLPGDFKTGLNGGVIQTLLNRYYDLGLSSAPYKHLLLIRDFDFTHSLKLIDYITYNPSFFAAYVFGNFEGLGSSISSVVLANAKYLLTSKLFLLQIIFFIILLTLITFFFMWKYNYLKLNFFSVRIDVIIFFASIFIFYFTTNNFFLALLLFFLVGSILYALKVNTQIRLLIISIVIINLTVVISNPQERYLFSLIPMILFTASYLSYIFLNDRLKKAVIIGFTLFFSPIFDVIGIENTSWSSIFKNKNDTIQELTLGEYDIIEPDLFEGCNLILSNNIKQIPLFSFINKNKIRQIFLYSPYKDFSYYPDYKNKSINCILTSKDYYIQKRVLRDLEVRYIDEYIDYRDGDKTELKKVNNFVLLKFLN